MTHRHLRAFVSSRMGELSAERRAVAGALESLYIQPFVYEDSAGARPDNARSTYTRELDESDLYIGIFWKGYGAYTIEEYEHAWLRRKPCLIYERLADDRAPELRLFLDRIGDVGGRHAVARFTSAEDLAARVATDVARWLADVVRGRGDVPAQAPPLSPRHVARSATIAELRERLFPASPGAAPRVRRAVLHGLAGSGKTALARELAHDPATLGAFPDGVLWVSLGKTPDLRQRLGDWGRALGDANVAAAGYPDTQTGGASLRTLLRERACLLVVDDVWVGRDLADFLVEGERCLLLVTTRRGDIAGEIGAERIEIPEMDDAVALRVLAERAGEITRADQGTARELAAAVGALPLALDLIAAQVARHGSWRSVHALWMKRRAGGLVRGRGARGREDNLLDSVELSLDDLAAADRAAYDLLAAFPEDVTFPASAAAALWGSDELDAADLLAELTNRALLLEQRGPGTVRYALHDVLHDVARERLGETGLVAAHAALVEGYRARCTDGWATGPDDGYFFEWLSHHLERAGTHDELYALVARDWLDAQFRRTLTYRDFATDVERAVAAAAKEPGRLGEELRGSIVFAALGSLASGLPPDTFNVLGRLGEIERARALATLVQRPRQRMHAFAGVTAGLAAIGRVAEAGELMEAALDALLASRAEGFSFSEIVAGLEQLAPLAEDAGTSRAWCAAVGRTLERETLFSDPESREHERLRIARRVRDAGRPAIAAALLGREVPPDPPAERKPARKPPTRRERAAQIAAHVETAETPAAAAAAALEALELIRSIEQVFERAAALTETIPSLSIAGLDVLRLIIAEVDAVLDSLPAEDEPNPDDPNGLMRRIERGLPDADGLNRTVAYALASLAQYDEARERANRLPPADRDGTRVAMAAAAANDGDFEAADALLEGMPPEWSALAAMVRAARLAADGAVRQGIEVVERAVLRPGGRALAFTKMAAALLDRGDTAGAADLAARAVAATEVLEDSGPVVAALVAVAAAEREHGDAERSLATLREAVTIARAVPTQSYYLIDLVIALFQQARSDDADAALEALADPAERLLPLAIGAGWLVRNGRVHEGLERLAQIETAPGTATDRMAVTALIADVHARAGHREEARQRVESFLAEASTMEDPVARAQALVQIQPVLSRLGDDTTAREKLLEGAALLLDRAEDARQLLWPQRPSHGEALATGRIAEALGRAGAYDEAIYIARAVGPLANRIRTILAVAETLGDSDPDRAAALATEAREQIGMPLKVEDAIGLLASAGALLHRLGRADGLEILRQARNALTTTDVRLPTDTRVAVIEALVKAGDWTDALDAARASLAAARGEGLIHALTVLGAAMPVFVREGGERALRSVRAALLDVQAWWGASANSPPDTAGPAPPPAADAAAVERLDPSTPIH